MQDKIKLTGFVEIKVKNLEGKILRIIQGNNLVLNTGYETLFGLLSGEINAGEYPNNVIKYAQFGTNATGVTALDKPAYFKYIDIDDQVLLKKDGRLNNFSPVLNLTHFSDKSNAITFQTVLPPAEGNLDPTSETPAEYVNYSEVVLMTKPNIVDPITQETTSDYKWFARKTFSPLQKSPSLLFELSWTFTFASA